MQTSLHSLIDLLLHLFILLYINFHRHVFIQTGNWLNCLPRQQTNRKHLSIFGESLESTKNIKNRFFIILLFLFSFFIDIILAETVWWIFRILRMLDLQANAVHRWNAFLGRTRDKVYGVSSFSERWLCCFYIHTPVSSVHFESRSHTYNPKLLLRIQRSNRRERLRFYWHFRL